MVMIKACWFLNLQPTLSEQYFWSGDSKDRQKWVASDADLGSLKLPTKYSLVNLAALISGGQNETGPAMPKTFLPKMQCTSALLYRFN